MLGLVCELDDKGTRKLRFNNKLLVYMTNLQGVICAILEVYTIANVLSTDRSMATKTITQLVTNIQCISKVFRNILFQNFKAVIYCKVTYVIF